MRGRKAIMFAAALVLVAGGTDVVCAQIQTASEPVVRTGQTAPGTGLSFLRFETPVINNAAYSVFAGKLSGATNTTDQGIWAGAASTLQLVAREGGSAPDALGTGSVGTFNRFTLDPFENNPLVESQSNIALFGWIEGPGITAGTNDTGLWVGTPGNMKLAARTGANTPGAPGETLTLINPAAFISEGILAFNGSSKNTASLFNPTRSGIWAGPQGNIQNYSLQGDQAGQAGELPDGVLYGFSNDTPTVNSSGFVSFRSALTGTGVTSSNNAAIFLGNSKATMKLIARTNAAVPGASGDVRFGSFVRQPAVNSAGTIAFHAGLTGVDVTNGSNTAILKATTTNATPSLVVREGEQAGGLSAGANYGEIKPAVVINSVGALAFITDLTGTGVDSSNNRAIFTGTTSFAPVARKGDQAPGTASGVKINLGDFTFSASINAGGQVAFITDLTGTGVNVNNQYGIWANDPFNVLAKVAREGDTIDLGAGVTKTIGFGLGFHASSGGGEGRQTSFNNSSQLSFTAPFTDGTSAVVNARVGGAARINASAPTLGAAPGNSFFTLSPLPVATYGTVSGDIGYLKFVGFSGGQLTVYLDFSGSNVAGAVTELDRHAGIYGYTVTTTGIGTFDALITYANANEEFFYWNFANINNVSLVGVQITPEPGSISIGLLGCFLLARRRR